MHLQYISPLYWQFQLHNDSMTPVLTRILEALAITLGGIGLFYLIFFVFKKWAREQKHFFPALLDKYLHGPGVMMFTLITLNIDFKLFTTYLIPAANVNIKHALHVLLIISIGYLLARMVTFLYEVLLAIYRRRDVQDYALRGVRTKYHVISRILHLVIVLSTITAVLLTFEQLRKFGTTFIASAGMAGIILGFAAQKSLSTIFAGIQIALTQSIKLDDIVTIENETGSIGEITLTYVVLNTWDEKRMILPINYFIDHHFENWTRVSAEVVGEVKIHVDYSLPVDEVRKEFYTWIKESKLWDRRIASLHISEAKETVMVLRATMSAKNSGDAGDLQTLIREKLILLLQQKYPTALPATHIKSTIRQKVATQMQNT
jgi:small-conductance mechanosensitive channel